MISRVRSVERSLTQDVIDNGLFVVGGNQDGDCRPRSAFQIEVRMTLPAEQTIQREPIMPDGIDADEEQS
jgi:hypothetical protein